MIRRIKQFETNCFDSYGYGTSMQLIKRRLKSEVATRGVL